MKDASTYLRILDKIRPSDEEKALCNFKATDTGCSWKQDLELNFGNKQLDLEDEEAEAIIKSLETDNNIAQISIRDASWMCELVEDLKNPKEPDAVVQLKKKVR